MASIDKMSRAFDRVSAAFPSIAVETTAIWRLKISGAGVEADDLTIGLDSLMHEASVEKLYPDDLMPRLYALARLARDRRLSREAQQNNASAAQLLAQNPLTDADRARSAERARAISAMLAGKKTAPGPTTRAEEDARREAWRKEIREKTG